MTTNPLHASAPRRRPSNGSFRRSLTGALAAIATALLCACGGSGDPSTASAAPEPEAAPPVVAVPIGAAITTQPAASTVTEGEVARFTVAASGDAPISYQWLRDGAAIGSATAATYATGPTTLADSGGLYSVTVSNAGGTVTSVSVALTVTAAAVSGPGSGGPSALASRYVEAWASADATAATGSLSLGVVDPDVPGTLITVDTLPGADGELAGGVVGPYLTLLRIYGGTPDTATGRVGDHGITHLVYVKGGAVYKLRLAKGSGVPVPERLSTESAAGSVTLCGQNQSGSDALICVAPASGFSGIRYVRLSTPASSAPLTAPTYVFAGNGARVPATLSTWVNDPATGEISAYLWLGERTFLTDPDFGQTTDLLTNTGVTVPFAVTPVALGEGRLRSGLIAYANGGLHRFDHATRTLTPIATGLTASPGWGLSDADALYLQVSTTTGGQVLKIADAAGAAPTVLVNGGVAQTPSNFRLLDDYLVFQADGGSGTATSVRKSDGASQTLALPAGGLVSFWEIGQSRSSGNRINYTRTEITTGNETGNVVGSVLADGADRLEFSGLIDVMNSGPTVIPAHQVAAGVLTRTSARVLVRTPGGMAWLDRASGRAGPVLGATLTQQFFGAPYTVMTPMIGSTGTAGLAANQTSADGRRIQVLDAYFIGNEAGSLQRLTSNIR